MKTAAEKGDMKRVRQSIWLLSLICVFLFAGCKDKQPGQSKQAGPPKADVDFAKEAFKLLVDGNVAAADMIDWEHLNMAGIDAGANYRAMTTDASREGFRNSFIRSYSESFKTSGASADVLSNWREQSRDSSNTVVAADAPNGNSLLITVSHADGQQKISVLAFKSAQPKAPPSGSPKRPR